MLRSPPPKQLGQSSGSAVTVNGAGATFPAPLINEWRLDFTKQDPNIQVNYQAIGSGAGIKQLQAKTVDFAASDAPLSKSQTKNFSSPVVHIPETIGSVVAAYNLPEFAKNGLNFTGPILADIFMGKIKTWDDPAIKAINPGSNLPSKPIVIIHRSDGSGTTFVWTSFLSVASHSWNSTIGHGTAVAWPTGVGQNGNSGVANTVQSIPYSIGYIELAYALTSKVNYGFIKNAAGKFVEPSIASTEAAVNAATSISATNSTMSSSSNSTLASNATITSAANSNLPAGDQSWASVSLLNETGPNSYPIATFTYILVYKDMSANIHSMDKAKAVAQFIQWPITDGQQTAPMLSYVSLPSSVIQIDNATLKSLTYNGQPVLP